MFPINSKTCTNFSKYFLIGSVFLLAWLMIIWFSRGLHADVAVVYYLSCLLSGISFIFATGTHLDSLKGWGMFVHFSSIYLVAVILVPLSGGIILIVSILTYLLVPTMLRRLPRKQTQQRKQMLLLGPPMLYSITYFIRINYYLMTFDGEIIKYLIFMSISGLIGLILSTGLDNGKAKWILLGINYAFATYFHIVIWILWR